MTTPKSDIKQIRRIEDNESEVNKLLSQGWEIYKVERKWDNSSSIQRHSIVYVLINKKAQQRIERIDKDGHIEFRAKM